MIIDVLFRTFIASPARTNATITLDANPIIKQVTRTLLLRAMHAIRCTIIATHVSVS